MKRALIISAHPDDEVLGCGGIISKYIQKDVKFFVLFIAEGSSCRFQDPNCPASLQAIEERTHHACKALSLLGISNYLFSDLPCGRLDTIPIIEINKIIERAVYEFNPDTIYTHSAVDANNDHRIVHRASIMATRPTPKSKVQRLLSYEINSSTEWSFGEEFIPTVFEQINENDLALKIKAMSVYKTEVDEYPFPRSEQGLRTLAMSRGMQSGVPLAEAFTLIREFVS